MKIKISIKWSNLDVVIFAVKNWHLIIFENFLSKQSKSYWHFKENLTTLYLSTLTKSSETLMAEKQINENIQGSCQIRA